MGTGECIKKARNKAGLKQSELAEQLGVAVITIGQYERGKRQPRLEQLQRIAQVLGTTVSELVEPDYWATVPHEEVEESWDSSITFKVAPIPPRDRVAAALDRMTQEGQGKVADYAEDILPRYKAGERPQDGGRATPAPQEGQSTTPPPDAPETPSEGV